MYSCLSECLRLRAPTGISRALPAQGGRPAVWDRSHEARGGSACGAPAGAPPPIYPAARKRVHSGLLDARGVPALRVSGRLERLSGGSGWRLRCRSDRGLRLTPVLVPAGRVVHSWRASATNTGNVTYRCSAARPAWTPLGCGARPPRVSAQANCVGSHLLLDCFPPRRAAGSAAHSVGSGRLRRSIHGSCPCLAHPSPGLVPAGPGANSVGEGLTLTAAPTSDPHPLRVSPVYGCRAPTVLVKG